MCDRCAPVLSAIVLDFLSKYSSFHAGYDTSGQFPFPVIGRNGLSLQARFTPHPETYLALCTDGFPNLFIATGPNSIIGTGSFMIIMERQVEYIVAATKKMQRERLKSMEVTAEAVKDFDEYMEVRFFFSFANVGSLRTCY